MLFHKHQKAILQKKHNLQVVLFGLVDEAVGFGDIVYGLDTSMPTKPLKNPFPFSLILKSFPQ